MQKQIVDNLGDAEALERLYRKDKGGFSLDFPEATAGNDSDLVRFWRLRLERDLGQRDPSGWMNDLGIIAILVVAMASVVQGYLLFPHLPMENYWVRTIPLVVFAGLSAWFIQKGRVTGWRNLTIVALPVGILLVFLLLLPPELTDASTMALLHAPVLMWFILGLVWTSLHYSNPSRVLAFIRFSGELVVMTGLLGIAGGMLSGMTIGLFSLIGVEMEEVFMANAGITGLVILPLIAVWLIDLYPDITSRIVPILARIFTPLVFIVLVVYLVTLFFTGIDLSQNRDSLILFNALLLGVMILIVFSLSELTLSATRKVSIILLFLLAVLSLVIDLVALSAIVTRLSDGFTVNRTIVLVSNLLVLINLLLLIPALFQAGFRGHSLTQTEKIITRYLPVYLLYSIVVVFLFTYLF